MPKNRPSPLWRLARQLRVRAEVAGPQSQDLSGGLRIDLERDGERWVLQLSRCEVWPGAPEVETLWNAFDVAEGTEFRSFRVKRVSPKTGAAHWWYGFELAWREVAEKQVAGRMVA